MTTDEDNLNDIIEKLDLLEKHIKRHWVDTKTVPDIEEVKVLQEELNQLVKEFKKIHQKMKVFKSW